MRIECTLEQNGSVVSGAIYPTHVSSHTIPTLDVGKASSTCISNAFITKIHIESVLLNARPQREVLTSSHVYPSSTLLG